MSQVEGGDAVLARELVKSGGSSIKDLFSRRIPLPQGFSQLSVVCQLTPEC